MAFSKKYYETAQKILSARRIENRQTENAHRAEIHEKIPEYSELECRLSENMSEIISDVIEKKPDSQAVIQEIIKQNLDTQCEMRRLLRSNGYSEDYLDPVFTCKKCKDTGSFEGKWCDCFNRILYRIAAEELNARSPLRLCSFDTFSLEYYSDKKDPSSGKSSKELMSRNLEYCKEFAENFSKQKMGILMLGPTGLGKTHLSLSIADELIKKGVCVVYGSVPELLRTLDKEQFGKSNGDTMQLLTECDLLILDDLGSESAKNDRYVSYLYECINARQNRMLPIIINSNLNQTEIQNRYQDRLWSRLFSMKVLIFSGDDNRLKIAMKN